MIQIPEITVDTAANAVADSIAPVEHVYGIMLTPPEGYTDNSSKVNDSPYVSLFLLGLFALFLIVALRFRNNNKFAGMVFRNIVETRTRQNVFDDTVKETSLLLILNLVCIVCGGIILYRLLAYTLPYDLTSSLPSPLTNPGIAIWACTLATFCYTCFMALAYLGVGTVFTDTAHARLWLKGFAASQALLAVVFFPLALIALCYDGWTRPIIWIAAIAFIAVKIVFIWKGMRIFLAQISSWLLFLYYLCSLEIVPLILTYLAAVGLWGAMA